MEKIQPLFSHLIRNRFWYLAGGVAIALLANWFLVSGALSKARSEGTSKIKGKISDINNVLNVGVENTATLEQVKVHPNEKTQEGMAAEIARNVDSLIAAWKIRRDAQVGLVKWPAEIIGSDRFVAQFSQYNPPEKFPGLKMTSDMEQYCQLYSQQIQKRMPLICEKINTRWKMANRTAVSETTAGSPEGPPVGEAQPPGGENPGVPAGEIPPGEIDPAAGGGQDPAAGDPAAGGDDPGTTDPGAAGEDPSAGTDTAKPDLPETIEWNQANQILWQNKLTVFKGQDRNISRYPTANQVLALQQDLWLLEAMFDVIAEVNGTQPGGPVVVNDLASIKRIDHIAFGREARSQLGQVIVPDNRLSSGGAGSGGAQLAPPVDPAAGSGERLPEDGAAPGALPGASDGQTAFSAAVPEALVSLLPFHGRYVDRNFQPLSVQAVHDALTAPVPPPEHLELVVARRVPFRIAVKMRESAIPAFIAACGNSDFEFEIAQVRINRHKAGEFINFNGSAPGNSLFGGKKAGSNDSSNDARPVPETRINDDILVEFKGVVRIYNPVDEERIRLVANQQAAPGT